MKEEGRARLDFQDKNGTSKIFWWVRHVLFSVAACFFLGFGILLLIAAYRLENPAWFIMTFFSSNLIILISGALLVGFIYRMMTSNAMAVKEDKDA